ncbi:hypothetical protein C0Q70_17740 [Pomacea canaliculata]|uniref:Uncharacterized protein n=1 Tax=Pomacea canaliculata TaxID=400727 RepID=A0A2T7NL85_POMCA|nr:hypothetical protein C0Q70_17740 [Pomacea canaliculata]
MTGCFPTADDKPQMRVMTGSFPSHCFTFPQPFIEPGTNFRTLKSTEYEGEGVCYVTRVSYRRVIRVRMSESCRFSGGLEITSTSLSYNDIVSSGTADRPRHQPLAATTDDVTALQLSCVQSKVTVIIKPMEEVEALRVLGGWVAGVAPPVRVPTLFSNPHDNV